ncbi:unnamed protein product [Symbiodinium natans]|uniref:Uncharacterized protein n=1 Tax=Symbiodinium natans TaxID=878477 RepID=A0A812PU03_9DINO|nr:unnamed protein product [Symbiodinium natans]
MASFLWPIWDTQPHVGHSRTVDGAFLLKGADEYVKWPIQLPGNFLVQTRFRSLARGPSLGVLTRVAHSDLTAVLFVFWDTAPKGARHPYFQSHQMDCDGSWLDQVGFVVNRQGSHILKSGAHWGSAVLFPGEVMEPQEWCGEWHDVSLERQAGQLTVTVDGKFLAKSFSRNTLHSLSSIPQAFCKHCGSMTWRVAAVGLRPHHESRSAIQIERLSLDVSQNGGVKRSLCEQPPVEDSASLVQSVVKADGLKAELLLSRQVCSLSGTCERLFVPEPTGDLCAALSLLLERNGQEEENVAKNASPGKKAAVAGVNGTHETPASAKLDTLQRRKRTESPGVAHLVARPRHQPKP